MPVQRARELRHKTPGQSHLEIATSSGRLMNKKKLHSASNSYDIAS
jgi:hypothetical protein